MTCDRSRLASWGGKGCGLREGCGKCLCAFSAARRTSQEEMVSFEGRFCAPWTQTSELASKNHVWLSEDFLSCPGLSS